MDYKIHILLMKQISNNNDISFVGFPVWNENEMYNDSYKILDLASIFSAECVALIHAIDLIINKSKEFELRIFLESDIDLKSLNNCCNLGCVSPLVIQLFQIIYYKQKILVKYRLNRSVVRR